MEQTANLVHFDEPCPACRLPEGTFVLAADGPRRSSLKCGFATVLAASFALGVAAGWYVKASSIEGHRR